MVHDRNGLLAGSLTATDVSVSKGAAPLSNSASDGRGANLQVFGVMVGPGQQHGGEQVSRPHKHRVHLGDVHADFLTGSLPVWFDCQDDTRLSRDGGMRQICVDSWTNIPVFWLPSATRNPSPCLDGRSVLVRTTVPGPIL